MFTGIIEEVGTVKSIRRSSNSCLIEIQAKKVLEDAHIGDSIAVNGVCLTVTMIGSGVFCADVMNETLSRSSLGSLKPSSRVDLERAMSASGRFGGHIVSGHIDGTGSITNIKNDGIAVWYTIAADEKILRYVVEKGSIAIDGISLTVAKVDDVSFSVSVIPHTAEQTVIGDKRVGDIVNLETDIVGKYIQKLMRSEQADRQSSINMDMLASNGFI